MLVRLKYRNAARNAKKAFTKARFEELVQPVLDQLGAEITQELTFVGLREYKLVGGEAELALIAAAVSKLAKGTHFGYTFANESEEGPNSSFQMWEAAA